MSRLVVITPVQAAEAIALIAAAQVEHPCCDDADGDYISSAAADMLASRVGDNNVRRVIVGDTDVHLAQDIWDAPVCRADIEDALHRAASGGIMVAEPDDYADM